MKKSIIAIIIIIIMAGIATCFTIDTNFIDHYIAIVVTILFMDFVERADSKKKEDDNSQ